MERSEVIEGLSIMLIQATQDCGTIMGQRDKAQAELSALRQSRAQERVQYAGPELEASARQALHVIRDLLDPPELVGTVQAVKDLLAGHQELMEQRDALEVELAATSEKLNRLDEASDTLRDEVARLKADVEMRDHDLAEEQENVRRLRLRVGTLEDEAEGYRKTISELRLTRPRGPVSHQYDDVYGPDIDPNIVDARGEEG